MSEKVFHGSPRVFDAKTANPRLNERIDEKGEVIFSEESFHATPHEWIALAYTYTPKPIEGLNGDDAFYSMGVNLYSDKKEVAIYGVDSLEESLVHLYGQGGYLYHFDKGGFVYKEGLGSQEVIATSPTTSIHIERVDDPVSKMLEQGVAFHFVDVSSRIDTNDSAITEYGAESVNEYDNKEITTEELDALALDKLYSSLNNRTIKNSDGADVTISVAREKMTRTDEEMWYITFDFEYNGRLINRRYPQTSNYIQLSVAPSTHSVSIDMAQLESTVLKGKNVYPQVVQLLSENFPDNFDLEAEFGHDKTKESILNAKEEYQQGKINIEQFKQKLLDSYLFQTRIIAGFNSFEITFVTKDNGEVTVRVKSKKLESLNQPQLIILGL